MNFGKKALSAIFAILCIFQYGFGAEQKQQVTVLTYLVPAYPPIARAARITGDVVLSFNVQGDGTVSDVNVISGSKFLVQRSVDAIKQWKFQCLSCGYGKPFHHQLTFSFRIDEKLSWRDHSIKYELPDKLTINSGPVRVMSNWQVSTAS